MAGNEYLYGGKTYSNDPKYNLMTEANPAGVFSGYNSSFADLGTSLDARTANQIKEISKQLNSGIRNVEIAGMDPGVFESMPRDHLKEINRLTKITGTEATIHAPMIDPSGISQEGWDKMVQNSAEKQLWAVVKRSHDLNPDGNVVVTMHASTAQLPAANMTYMEDGKIQTKSALVIDPQGKIGQLKYEEKFFPTEEGVKPSKEFNPEKEIARRNKEKWVEDMGQMNYYANMGQNTAEEIIGKNLELKKITSEMEKNGQGVKELKERLSEGIDKNLPHADLYLKNAYQLMKRNFEMIYKNASEEEKENLDKFANKIAPNVKSFENPIEKAEQLEDFSKLVQEGVNVLRKVTTQPKMLQSLREFAIDKTAETASNLAFEAYKKFGNTAPIISLENHPAQASILTTGEDLRDVVTKAREMFVSQAIKKRGLSENEAEKQAEKLIGATWDVGHINMLKRYGYKDKDIIKQSEKVAPFVKHVHLSDNFGFEHTELPMGMGNVPIKEIMARLDQEGFKGKKVVEALSWWQHFSEQGANHAIIPTMQGMGVPMYSGGMGGNQIYGIPGGYFTGYGTMLPEQHFSLYGTGFSNLPMELGGQISGKDSRFSGTPMS